MQWTRNPTSRSNVISLLTIIWKPHALFTITLGSKNVTRYHFYSHNYYYPKVSYSSRALDKVPPTHVPFFCLQKFYKDRNDLINKNFLFIKVFSREKKKKKKKKLTYPGLWERLTQKFKAMKIHSNLLIISTFVILCTKLIFQSEPRTKHPYGHLKEKKHLFIYSGSNSKGVDFPFFPESQLCFCW